MLARYVVETRECSRDILWSVLGFWQVCDSFPWRERERVCACLTLPLPFAGYVRWTLTRKRERRGWLCAWPSTTGPHAGYAIEPKNGRTRVSGMLETASSARIPSSSRVLLMTSWLSLFFSRKRVLAGDFNTRAAAYWYSTLSFFSPFFPFFFFDTVCFAKLVWWSWGR